VTLALISKHSAATTYQFRNHDGFGWALCTVNDATGELLITSDYGNWSHRWSPDPVNLGHPTLTAFIGNRGDVDYLARKLQREGRAGRQWSATLTVQALRKQLCWRRLEDGRERIDHRQDNDDMPSHRHDEHGLPIYGHRMPAEHRIGRPWDFDGKMYDTLPYLTRDAARDLWSAIGACADECGGGDGTLFYERLGNVEGFQDYVSQEPWNYGETEQTPEDKALRNLVLPALILACAGESA
jgi:hypothetical protein